MVYTTDDAELGAMTISTRAWSWQLCSKRAGTRRLLLVSYTPPHLLVHALPVSLKLVGCRQRGLLVHADVGHTHALAAHINNTARRQQPYSQRHSRIVK